MRLLAELRAIQEGRGYLAVDDLKRLSLRLQVPLHRLEEVVSFFPTFCRRASPRREVRVCTDLACHLSGPGVLAAAGEAATAETLVSPCSCLGACDRPVAVLAGGQVVAGLGREAVVSLVRGRTVHEPSPAPERSFRIDPYGGPGRYEALARVAEGVAAEQRGAAARGALTGGAVIVALADSGLRGMGGAGFPSGAKWDLVRGAAAEEKFAICNADESEPGAFKDRFLLEHFPDLVVEGLAIAATVVGAAKAWIFLRHEYARQRHTLAAAIERYTRARAFRTGPEIDVFESPGGYICGEETALLEVMEGRRGEPRHKPPFPSEQGLWGRPTLVNNVETLAWVPAILLHGADWFAQQGVNGARGLKLVSLSGHVAAPGVYEVPLGTRARDLIFEHGGGVSGGRDLKAFSPGGPSSGFLPARLGDIPLSFSDLQRAGSMLGAGAFLVLADGTCMLDAALNFLRFFRAESCGTCVPCRIGTEKLVRLLGCWGESGESEGDLQLVEELAAAMEATSICGLGQSAPAPLRSLLRYFPEEIEAHRQGRCPAGNANG